MTDIDEMLDDRETGGGGDFPPWMDDEDDGVIHEEGDTLMGLVTRIRDDPFHDEDEDEGDPAPILHVTTEDGDTYSTRTHRILANLIDELDVEVGDLVRVKYTGTAKTKSGHMANNYKLACVKPDEFEDFGIDPDDFAEVEELEADGGSAAAQAAEAEESGDEIDDEVLEEAVEFAESLVDFHGGLELEELDKYLNETREMGLDPEVVAEAAGLEVEDGEVKPAE